MKYPMSETYESRMKTNRAKHEKEMGVDYG
jgi:hypothetical protein